MSSFVQEVWKAARQAPRIYFAPLRGLYAGLKEAWEILERGSSDDPMQK
jgi:hypothetical protein